MRVVLEPDIPLNRYQPHTVQMNIDQFLGVTGHLMPERFRTTGLFRKLLSVFASPS